MNRSPNACGAFPSSENSNFDVGHSCEQETEQLAKGVSEMVLKSPTEKKSKLSADAPEFVPSWMKAQAAPSPQQSNASNFSNVAERNKFADVMAVNQTPDSDISHYLLSDIQMYVAHLQTSPESFNEIALTILDLLTNFAYNDILLAGAANEIFLAGLQLGNFSYHCARLCAYLAANYWGYGGAHSPSQGPAEEPTQSFRDLLLKRCREEHQARLAAPLPCLYDYGLLLADLYNQLKVENQNLAVLGNAVFEVVSALLAQPNDGNVAGAVSILKCCGLTMERSERSDGEEAKSPKLNVLFSKFELLLQTDTTQYGLSEDGKTLIRNLLKSRADWNKYSAQMGDGYQQQQSYQPNSSDTVFFGPDGQELTAEETAFLEQELANFQSSSSGDEEASLHGMLSAEDDAIDDAYEKFLKMTEAKRKQQGERKN